MNASSGSDTVNQWQIDVQISTCQLAKDKKGQLVAPAFQVNSSFINAILHGEKESLEPAAKHYQTRPLARKRQDQTHQK